MLDGDQACRYNETEPVKGRRRMAHTLWQNPWIRAVTTFLTVAVMIMIFCFSMENADLSDRRSGFFADTLIRIIHPDFKLLDEAARQAIYERTQFIVRKCAHFTEYMVLGFFLRLCLESWFGHRLKKYRVLALTGFGAGTGYACTDELHQLSIDGRSGQWGDVLVDACGVLAGVTLATMLIRVLANRKAIG